MLTEQDGLPVVGPSVTLVLRRPMGQTAVVSPSCGWQRAAEWLDSGALKHGTTFPASESVTVMLPDAGPADDVFIPGGGAGPDPTPASTPAAEPLLRPSPSWWSSGCSGATSPATGQNLCSSECCSMRLRPTG